MIRYALVCDHGHDFESWFRDSRAFDVLSSAGQVGCPVCGSAKVDKQIMAPKIARGTSDGPSCDDSEPENSPAPVPTPLTGHDAMVRHLTTAIRQTIVEQSDYVGPEFAEEARRMHYGETEHRPIWGEATLNDARELIEEGIAIAPVPDGPGEGH
jgi:hypothetical protein